MGLIRDLVCVFKEKWSKDEETKSLYRIVPAFKSGGKQYYCYEDINNIPFERGLAALTIFNEIEMKCSIDFLKRYTKAIDELLHERVIDVYKLNALNNVLMQRLNLSLDVDLMYKLASVVFFDKSENPTVYEQTYAEKKIERWKKDETVTAFFLKKPIRDLMPFLKNAPQDLDTYSRLNEEINELHSTLVRLRGSMKEQNA